jgi:cyclohexyl-isocyanide hydratase
VIPENVHLNIGSLLFENLDQIDLTSPYEVLSNIPNATHRIYARGGSPSGLASLSP